MANAGMRGLRGDGMTRRGLAGVAVAGLLLAACSSGGPGGASNTVVMIPDYQPGGGTVAAAPQGYSPAGQPITVGLGETDATHMFIDLSQAYSSEGTVTFVVTNGGTETHEFVVLRTDAPAGSLPIVSFEGEPNRINEDAKGVTNVGETGDMEPGTTMTLSLDLAPGHYAVVCNLSGHYAMGMHQDFNVVPAGSTPITVSLGETDATHMFIDLSQSYAPEGKVTFIITNTGAEGHELVVLATDTAAADFPITGFDGEPNRFDEDAKGLTNVGETGDPAMAPGTSMMLTIDMSAGHYAAVCNLNGHYAMGMHQDFNVVPAGSTPITVSLGETDATHMFIDLSQSYAPEGKVTFIITNTGAEGHELVVLATDTAAADFPITGFDGEPNRFDEDAKGLTNVGETGDPAMAPGTSMMLTIDMSAGHYAAVCNLNGHYAMGMHQDFNVVPAGSTPITVSLGETDATHMFIDLSQSYAPEGKVTFIITNTGAEGHELVVLATDTAAADFPITGFDGEPNRFDEDAKGLTNVGETGDPAMAPGTSMMLTIDMSAGHYAAVCNLNGHYAMGMHQDFNVVPAGSTPITVSLGETDATHMFIDLSQSYAPEGKVTFIITNTGAEGHELVVLATDTAAADFPITGFDGEPNRFDEDAKGLTNVGETGDPAMAPGTSMMLTIDMSAGHYAAVCNLNGHYAMGMHQDVWITPAVATV